MLSVRRQGAAAVVGAVLLCVTTPLMAGAGGTEAFVTAALVYELVVVIVAVLGGLIVALSAALVSAVLLNFFFAEPVHTVLIRSGAHVAALVVFVLVGAIVSFIVGQSEARLVLARRSAEAEANAAAAQEADRVKTALVAVVGHDLRTPLAAASAAVTSLASDDVSWTDEQRAELLSTSISSLRRLERLVDDLLDSSRIDAGVLPVFPEAMRAEDAAAGALDEIGPAADGVRLDLGADVPDVFADPRIVQRILVNLVGNALRHAGGDIEVVVRGDGDDAPVEPPDSHGRPETALPEQGGPGDGARGVRQGGQASEPGFVEIAVVDHGPGIPDERLEHAFLPLQRRDDSSAGAGIGLSLSRGLADALGGRLVATATPGGGLTCTLFLPAAEEEP